MFSAAAFMTSASLSRAWSVKFVAGEWDNESDENVIEQVTLTYDFVELVQ
jgi:hypothetical protein